jgi:hypothetical protein
MSPDPNTLENSRTLLGYLSDCMNELKSMKNSQF